MKERSLYNWIECILKSDLPAQARHLAHYLSTFMNSKQHIAFPSQARIVAETRLSKATVNRYLKVLDDSGWLVRESGNSSKNTRYIPDIPSSFIGSLTQRQSHTETVSDGDLVVSHRDYVVSHRDTNNQDNKQDNKQDNSENPSDSTVKPPQVPYEKIRDLYHQVLSNHPRIEKWTPKRKNYIKQLWREELPDLNNWENFFHFITQSKFLTGNTEPGPGYRPFIANLEWLTNPNNYVKIIEGNYHGKV